MSDPMYPILNDPMIKAIPWDVIRPHENQAKANHGQTLSGLANRGGLDVGEAVDILLGNRWGTTKDYPWCRAKLMLLVMQFDRDKRATALAASPRSGQQDGGGA